MTESKLRRSYGAMEYIDTNTIKHALLASPHWARTSLAAPSDRLRQQAAEELARRLLSLGGSSKQEVDPNQLGLDL